MFCKVPYTEIGGRHRPYLEVVFSNPDNSTVSNKTFAMVDSGADHTIIPFSLGSSIGLSVPPEEERLASISGVGGDLSYIERRCRIYLANKLTDKVYSFDETVWWIYPDAQMQAEQRSLVKNFEDLEKLRLQSVPGTELHTFFEGEKKKVIDNLLKILNRLETGTLLGRPFFDNFEFIQFCNRDRHREDRCYFNYKVAKGKPAEIKPLQQAPAGLIGKVQTAVKKL